MKNEKEKESASGLTWTLQKLALLLDETERQIQRIADEGFIPKPAKRGEYDFQQTIRGVVKYYKTKAAAVTDSAAADRARQAKADADLSEMQRAKIARKFVFAKDVLQIWQDGFVQIRLAIRKAKKIPESSKPEIVSIIQSVKLDTEQIDEAIDRAANS